VVLEGQIGLKDTGNWPLIQLYDFTIGNFDVFTNKPEAMKEFH
jgi:hypothetical protein